MHLNIFILVLTISQLKVYTDNFLTYAAPIIFMKKIQTF